MTVFNYKNGELYCEKIAISKLIKTYQSPLYVYSKSYIIDSYKIFDNAFLSNKHLVCYAVKANSNIAVLEILAKLGSGFDVVSVGELERVLLAGGSANKCVFSGVAKSSYEIKRALEVEILYFNVESEAELLRIRVIADSLKVKANISIRVNPDIDAKTHPHISTGLKDNKFGISIEYALSIYKKASKYAQINIVGISCHIGSQITTLQPFLAALDKVLELVFILEKNNINLTYINLGGGTAIEYKNTDAKFDITAYIKAITEKTNKYITILEPGRAIVGNSGAFITKIEFLKQNKYKSFAIVDGAMNDFIRPTLYGAYHEVLTLTNKDYGEESNWDIVGPVCESSDFLAKDRKLKLTAGDYLALLSAGAYCFTMSSNYNSRKKVAEVMVYKDKYYLIRQRETTTDLWRGESLCKDE